MKRRIKHIQNIYKCNRQFINKTPLQLNKRLSQKYECNIYLKREDLQEVRSFKIRGAYNKLINLSNIEKKNGIVCASAGNHAQGVALSCNNLEIVGDIFIPDNTPKQKIKSIKRFMNSFSNLHIVGENFDESLKKAIDFMTINNKTFIHPFDDDDIINGQATIGVEILILLLEQLEEVV